MNLKISQLNKKNKVQGQQYCTTLVNLLHDPFGVVYFDKINGPSNIQIFHCCFSLMYKVKFANKDVNYWQLKV